jgi:hypothetical protein
MISYSGVSNSKSARGADTMTASVPLSAPLTPPLLIQFGECLACDAEAVDGGGDARVNGNGANQLLAETFVEATQQRDIDRALLAA